MLEAKTNTKINISKDKSNTSGCEVQVRGMSRDVNRCVEEIQRLVSTATLGFVDGSRRGFGNFKDDTSMGPRVDEFVELHAEWVGTIIGKGGETISFLERKANCVVSLPRPDPST